MAQQVLVVEERVPVLEVLRQHLDEAGFKLEVASPSEAPGRLRQGVHALAIVGFVDSTSSEIVAALKGADPTLPVVALFAEGGDAANEALVADGLLVGPLTGPMVVSCCRAMARLAAQARRIADLERIAHRPSGGEFYDYEFFKKLLLMEVKRSRRHRYPISLALVGVDRWKEVSAPLRGPARAALLGNVLHVMARAIRDIDLPLLYSHERLLVFMPHTGSPGALQVASRLCHRVRSHRSDIPVTVSAGVASFEGQGAISFALLTRQATQALHQAQIEGGDRAVRFGPTPKRSRILIG
jgi:two-component system, cell cycle response regulator